MVKEFSTISELRHIREQKSRLSEREQELASPILTDYSLIGEIYAWFKEILNESACPPNLDTPLQRKKFLFIILFLYSPSTLAGGKMNKGMRKALEGVFSNIKPCSISNSINNVVFIYQHYKQHRQDVDYIYTKIVEKLKEKVII